MSQTALVPTTPVFTNGEDGIGSYRIPAIVKLPNGDLLAAAEARVLNSLDHGGPIRVVVKRSTDNGQTWGPLIEVARNILPDGEEQVAQNPSPVVDTLDPNFPDGRVFLIFNKADMGEHDTAKGKAVRRICVIESHDGGETWINERDITSDVHRPHQPTYTRVYEDAATRYNFPDDWRTSFPPVGHAIQLRGGANGDLPSRGRLLFSTFTTVGDRTVFEGQAYLIYSDDHGETWQHDDVAPVYGVNEMMAIERANGDILVNFRNYTGPGNAAAGVRGHLDFTLQEDGSFAAPDTWTDVKELRVPGSGLQGSIIRRDEVDAPGATDTLYFSGADNAHHRVGMTVWTSTDKGATWPSKQLVDPGPSAYSDMVMLDNGSLGLLYELGGDEHGIVFAILETT